MKGSQSGSYTTVLVCGSNILTEGIHILTGDCKRVHDRHAAYRVVCLEGQLLGAGDGELPVLARAADKEVRCSLGGVNLLKKSCTKPVTQCLNCQVCHTSCCNRGSRSDAEAMAGVLVLAQANGFRIIQI